jgi:cytochrome c2
VIRCERTILKTGFLLAVLLCGCKPHEDQPVVAYDIGNPVRGARLIHRISCGACHSIPGIPGAHGRVGPPLAGFARRIYIAGVLPNTPTNLVRWVIDPPAIAPMTAMPVLGLTPRDARDVAAYLYTLH